MLNEVDSIIEDVSIAFYEDKKCFIHTGIGVICIMILCLVMTLI